MASAVMVFRVTVASVVMADMLAILVAILVELPSTAGASATVVTQAILLTVVAGITVTASAGITLMAGRMGMVVV
jgi:hypothetical protein